MKKRINRALAYLLTLATALALLPAITPPPASAGVGDTWTSCGGVPWTVGSSYSGSWTFTSANNNDRTTAYEMTGTGGTLMVSSGVIYLVFNNYIGGARMTVAAGAHAVVFLPDGTVNAVINGVNVPPGATLTIEGGARGTGTLTAVCTSGAAGIGGNHLQSSGTINILGGTVTAKGSSYSAGIGAGRTSDGTGIAGGTTNILGNAKVLAVGASRGAGIGGAGGNSGSAGGGGGTITIGNGTDYPMVVALGGQNVNGGAGIGAASGGGGGSNGSSGGAGTITIKSGFVVAKTDNTYSIYARDIGSFATASGGTVTINGGSVYAARTGINPAPRNKSEYGNQVLSLVPALAEDADANPVGGADVSTVVNAGLGTEYDYSVITSEEAALPDDFVTAVNTALGEGFFEGIEGRAWLWLPTSGQTYDIKGHKDRFGGDLTEDVTAPSTLETIVLRQTTITPNTYARERDSHITLTVTGRSVVGTTDAARSATIKYFREPVNNALSLTDGIAADTTAFDDAYDDANALTANKMDTMPFVKDGASKDTRSIFKETIPANQNARYWVLAAYTVDGDTVYDVTHYDVKNIFTTAPVWMDGYDENPTGDISVRVDEFARELLIPVDGSVALKTAIPFDLAETMPHKDDFDTRGEYDWGGSALEVVDLSGLSTEYTNAGLAYDEIDLYPIAYQKNLYAWEYSYVQNEMPKLWGAAASGDKFPTVKLDGDFIDTSKNTYCNNNDPQHYIAWLIKGEAYKKIWAEFVNVNGQPVTIDTKTGMDILVPINEGYVTDATVVPGGPDDWVVSGAPNDGDFHGTWDSGRFRGVGGAIKPPRDTVVPHGWYVANTAITNVDLTDTNTDQTGTSGFVPRYDFYQIDPKLHVDSISESGGYYSLTGGDRFYIVYDIPIPVEVITNHRSAVGTGDPLGFTPTFTPITTNDYEFEAYGAADFMHSYVAVGVEAYYLTDKTQADDLTNRTYLPYTITGDDVLAAEKIGTHTGRVDPTFVGAPWESQDAFFGIKIDNSKLYTLTNQIIYVNFYYAPAGGDGIPTDESVTVTVRWRSAAVDGTILRTLLFDGRAGAEIYVPNDLPFTYDADLEKDVADMSYVKYGGAVNTADLGDDAHILTDADGHKWDWVDTHVGAAESILPYASDVLERTSGTKDEDYIFFDYEQETYAVTVEDGDGDGDFAGGAAVSVTADAAPSGKVFDKWTSDDGVVFDDENSESTTFTMLDNAVTVTATYKDPPSSYVPATPSKPKPEPEPDFRFIDVAESDWFHGDVYYVFENGLMVGTGADTFSPNEPMTRGMLVTVLGRLHGVDVAERAGDAAPYDDVDPEMYYAPYIAWAAENGIVLGVGENRFEPDRAIKREELAALFARYTASMDNQDESVLEVFSDNAKISDYARAPMAWAVGRALIIGMGDGTVKPAGYATRAQVAAVLHRFAAMDS